MKFLFNLLNYKYKKLEAYEKDALLDKEVSKLTKNQLRKREKNLYNKIQRYSFVEMIFVIALIFTFWYCYIAIQNNDNAILASIIFALVVLILIALWFLKRKLKRKRLKYLLMIEEEYEQLEKDEI